MSDNYVEMAISSFAVKETKPYQVRQVHEVQQKLADTPASATSQLLLRVVIPPLVIQSPDAREGWRVIVDDGIRERKREEEKKKANVCSNNIRA